ncbi:MAG TPA: glycoside hydrolase family 28 protein [Candidatus Acidoferrum sp.]|nr:glycoside hydrolase family 28 protein [Candidatus Acidoferrum sp.]
MDKFLLKGWPWGASGLPVSGSPVPPDASLTDSKEVIPRHWVQYFKTDLLNLNMFNPAGLRHLLLMRPGKHFLWSIFFVTFSLPAADGPRLFDVREWGARGDGKTPDTAAVQKALDECGRSGGGTVKFSRGTYLCQPLTVPAKTTMLLEAGATLLASPVQSDFLKGGGDWLKAKSGGDFIPFISGKDAPEVTIAGEGTIDGNGAVWWDEAEKARQKVPGFTLPRPNLIVFTRCDRLRLTGVRLVNSPKFHFVPTECNDVTVDHVTILAPVGAANTDGIDPSNCRNVTITRCTIDTGDDNIAIKSGKKVPGREFGCENITVTDCVFRHGHGLSIGSETVGGVRHLVVRNCRFDGTENGIRIKSRRGKGGTVEEVSYSDITMTNVFPALSIACYYQDSSQAQYPKDDPAQPVTDTTPSIRNIRISNLTATSTRNAGLIVGLPESEVSEVWFDNVHITAQTGLTIANAKGIKLKNTDVAVKSGPPFFLDKAQVEGLTR